MSFVEAWKPQMQSHFMDWVDANNGHDTSIFNFKSSPNLSHRNGRITCLIPIKKSNYSRHSSYHFWRYYRYPCVCHKWTISATASCIFQIYTNQSSNLSTTRNRRKVTFLLNTATVLRRRRNNVWVIDPGKACYLTTSRSLSWPRSSRVSAVWYRKHDIASKIVQDEDYTITAVCKYTPITSKCTRHVPIKVRYITIHRPECLEPQVGHIEIKPRTIYIGPSKGRWRGESNDGSQPEEVVTDVQENPIKFKFVAKLTWSESKYDTRSIYEIWLMACKSFWSSNRYIVGEIAGNRLKRPAAGYYAPWTIFLRIFQVMLGKIIKSWDCKKVT